MPSIYNNFKYYNYGIRSGDYVNIKKRVIRVWNNIIKAWCDIGIRPSQQGELISAKSSPSRWTVSAAGVENGKVDNINPDNPSEGVGNADTAYILGDLIHSSPVVPVQSNTSLQQTAVSGPEKVSFSITDPSPGVEERDEDAEVKNEGRSGITLGDGVTITDGRKDNIHIGKGIGIYPDNGPLTEGTQNKDYAGGMFTNSLNFLQHYLIPLAQSAGLHVMNHVINLPKYVGIGLFVRNVYNATKFAVKEIKKEV